jgi:hypothetical protein
MRARDRIRHRARYQWLGLAVPEVAAVPRCQHASARRRRAAHRAAIVQSGVVSVGPAVLVPAQTGVGDSADRTLWLAPSSA